MSESRQGKRSLARQRHQKHVPQFFLKNSMNDQGHANYKIKGLRGSKDSLLKLKNSSLKSTKSEASLLPEHGYRHRKYSPIEESAEMGPLVYQPHIKDTYELAQPAFGSNGVMTRKYSHINKLAQNLALDSLEESMGIVGYQNLKNQNANTLNEKLTTIKFKRRRHSNQVQSNSFRNKRIIRSKIEFNANEQ